MTSQRALTCHFQIIIVYTTLIESKPRTSQLPIPTLHFETIGWILVGMRSLISMMTYALQLYPNLALNSLLGNILCFTPSNHILAHKYIFEVFYIGCYVLFFS